MALVRVLPLLLNAGLNPELLCVLIGLLVVCICFTFNLLRLHFPYPIINHKASHWTYRRAKHIFHNDARRLLLDGFARFREPFGIVTDDGPMVILPPDYIEPVNQEPDLSLAALAEESFLADHDTFRSFRDSPPGLLHDAVITGLTRSLPKQVTALSEQMEKSLDTTWGCPADWHEVALQDDILSWVTRLSSRVFHGPTLSENDEWVRISVDYTVNSIKGVGMVRAVPFPFRWLAERVLPICRKIRADFRSASHILHSVSVERQVEIDSAAREGRKPVLPDDSFEWIRNASKGRTYNEVDVQLRLSAVAIHTSTDLLQQAVLNLCINPELFQPLRDEVSASLASTGWTKATITSLSLMDSFLKETQRMKPIGTTFMHRVALTDITLPNDIHVSKGRRVAISSHRMWNPEIYGDPEHFNAYRFRDMRETAGLGAKGQLVTTSQDHTAFGHGRHACPGRFFAAMEVKVALMHLLLKYDMQLDEPEMAKPKSFGFSMSANADARIKVRRRVPADA